MAVFTRTATEVGGDYYDFHLAGDVLSVTIGDATGHGAKAGTMVTVIKTLFSGYGGSDLARTGRVPRRRGREDQADGPRAHGHGAVLGAFDRRHTDLASAGMPPGARASRGADSVEEIALEATPLGTLGTDYAQISSALAAGDTVLFLTDGFPELMNDAGQQLGYTRSARCLRRGGQSGQRAAA